jgi:hypothetical protein
MSAAEALQQEIKQQGEVVKNLKAEKKVHYYMHSLYWPNSFVSSEYLRCSKPACFTFS